MKNLILGVTLAGACCILAGCISHEETVVRDVERVKVEFENDTAARIFYETLSKNPVVGNRSESTTRLDIPVVFDHKRKVVNGPNTSFNESVSVCDTNKDGRITEMEAKIFSEMRHNKK